MLAVLDRFASASARRLLAWTSGRVDDLQRSWLEAMTAELEAVDGGARQLLWAAGSLRLVWMRKGQPDVAGASRLWSVPLAVFAASVLVLFPLRLAERYPLISVVLIVLTALGVAVALPLLTLAAAAVRRCLPASLRSARAAALGAPATILLLVLGLAFTANLAVTQVLASGPDNAGLVVGPADGSAVTSLIDRAPGVARGDSYLTTQVRPLTINGIPLAQLGGAYGVPVGSPAPGLGTILPQQVTWLAHRFSRIQGFDLAHGQVPEAIGFGSDIGSEGPGPSEIDGPAGRMIDRSDANSLNVMIPLTETPDVPGPSCIPGPRGKGPCSEFRAYNGDTIGVQSLATGEILELRVVGEYTPEDGTVTQLYGNLLADDSVVRTLSGGHPSTAIGLRLDATQRSAFMARIHTFAPTARLYDLSGNSSQVPDLNSQQILWTSDHPTPLLQAAAASAILISMLIFGSRRSGRRRRPA